MSCVCVSISRSAVRRQCISWVSLNNSFASPGFERARARGASHREPDHNQKCAELTMNTILLTSQIVCYGVGIVSASLNIARFVRRRHDKWQRKFRVVSWYVTRYDGRV